MSPIVRLTDPELLARIKLKNRAGAEAVYDQYAKVLHLAIFRIVKQQDLADELLEKCFGQIWNSIDQYAEQDLSLLAWMLAIAKSSAKAAVTISKEPMTAA